MAEQIEVTIQQLKLSAQQKEDFVSNFSHELKTPLTSVIGYADMIYHNSNLTRAEIKNAAGYIVNEGMRLEALSKKMMELIILNRHNFTLIEMYMDEMLARCCRYVNACSRAKWCGDFCRRPTFLCPDRI